MQSPKTALVNVLLRVHCVRKCTTISGYAGLSSSSFSGHQSETSRRNVLAAHNEVCNTNPPEVPTNCCMSGCANCVYIEYAVDMANHFKDTGMAALEVIDKIQDETLKTFLKMEIEHTLPKKSDKS